jgi:hypothetical protein
MHPTRRLPRSLVLAAMLACLPLLAGCGRKDQDAAAGTAPPSALGNLVKRATDEAREKLATENISLSHDRRNNRTSLPKAEITPQGDLLIAGETVEIDEQQRALLLQHRAHLVAIAEAGIAVGVQGADLGMKAASMAIKSVFSGNTEQLERDIEAEAGKIEAEAMKICDLLPALMASQQALAAALPPLAPYATMTRKDIDDCRSDASDGDGPAIEA